MTRRPGPHSRPGNFSENVFNPFTDGFLSHKPKYGVRAFPPVGNFNFENLDCPVAERVPPRFGNSPQILPCDVHAYQRNARTIVPTNAVKSDRGTLRWKAPRTSFGRVPQAAAARPIDFRRWAFPPGGWRGPQSRLESASRISSIDTTVLAPGAARKDGHEATAAASEAHEARMARFSARESVASANTSLG
jgi:hypothetical protein